MWRTTHGNRNHLMKGTVVRQCELLRLDGGVPERRLRPVVMRVRRRILPIVAGDEGMRQRGPECRGLRVVIIETPPPVDPGRYAIA